MTPKSVNKSIKMEAWSLLGSILDALGPPSRSQETPEWQVGDGKVDSWGGMDAPRVDFETHLVHQGSLRSRLWSKKTTLNHVELVPGGVREKNMEKASKFVEKWTVLGTGNLDFW